MGPSRFCIPGRTLAPLLDATGLHIFMTGKSKRSFAKIHVLSKEKVFKQT